MLRIPVPVVLLLLALVIPRLPAIPTGAASKHRVPRTEESDLEDDTDVLVQDVDQVMSKMNKVLGDTGDSVDTDANDGVKGLSVKTTEVRITPPQDQTSDEDDDDAGEIPKIPVEPSPGEEEALATDARPGKMSLEDIGEDAVMGEVIKDALENDELMEYFLGKARDAEDALLGDSVPPAFLSSQMAPEADDIPEENLVEEQPEPVVGLDLDDEETLRVLEEMDEDFAAQGSDDDSEEDLDEEEEDAIDASVLGLFGPQKSVPIPDDDEGFYEDEDDDDDEGFDVEEEDDDDEAFEDGEKRGCDDDD